MNKKLLGLLIVPALVLGGFGVGAVTAPTSSAVAAIEPAPADLQAARQAILAKTNAVRAQNGVPPLVLNSQINTVAQSWSLQMATEDRMYHNPAQGSQFPAGWYVSGENVGYGYATIDQLMSAWVNSPSHFKNLIKDNYTEIGIGYYISDSGVPYYTQNFAGYSTTKTAPAATGGIEALPAEGLSGTANIRFYTPTFYGNLPTSYRIDAVASGYPTVSTTIATPNAPVSSELRASISGLVGGVNYSVTVTPFNAAGSARPSPASNVTTYGVPSVQVTAVTPEARSAVVSFAVNNGGLDLTGLSVTLNGGATQNLATNATTASFTGLTPGKNYSGTVVATNSIGSSVVQPFTFDALAIAPDSVSVNATIQNSTSVALNWTNGAFDGGAAITGYDVTITPDGGTATTVSVPATAKNHVFANLVRGVNYSYTVTVKNRVGGTTSPAASITVPYTKPSVPTGLTAELVDEQTVDLAWVAPTDNGGKAIVEYTVHIFENGTQVATKTTTGTSLTLTSEDVASNRTYTYTISASNGTLVSNESSSAEVVVPRTPTAPDAATNVKATNVAPTSLTASWTAPDYNGGTAITGYLVEVFVGATRVADKTVSDTTTSTNFTGLSKYTTHTIKVTALNKKGASPVAELTNVRTLATAPSVPQNVKGSVDTANTLTIVWDASADNGGDSNLVYTYVLADELTGETIASGDSLARKVIFENAPLDKSFIFAVFVKNSAGSSSTVEDIFSANTSAEPVSGVSATYSENAVDVSFTAPTDFGTLPLAGYQVVVSADGKVAYRSPVFAGTSRTVAIDDSTLFHGKSYTFTVVAVTGAGIVGKTGATSTATVAVPAIAPNAPTGVKAASDGTTVELNWTAPSFDGGAAIESYEVIVSDSNDVVVPANTSIDGTTATITGLDPLENYTVSVSATNSAGLTSPVATDEFSTGVNVPAAPTNVAIAFTGDSNVGTVSWTAPAVHANEEAELNYNVVIKNTSNGSVVASYEAVTATSKTFTGVRGASVYAEVVAVVVDKSSTVAASGNVSVPTTTPDSVTSAVSVKDSVVATVSWTAPTNNGGTAITGYKVVITDANDQTVVDTTVAANVLSYEFVGEPSSEYTVSVAAVNANGRSAYDNKGFVTSAVAPSAARNPVVVLDEENLSLTATWDAPSKDGGDSNISYDYKVHGPSGVIAEGTTENRSVDVEGLLNGKSYYVSVVAKNSAGSAAAITSATVAVPAVAPSVPANVKLTADKDNRITATWEAPAFDGGAEISSYRVDLVDAQGTPVQTAVASATAKTFTFASTGIAPNKAYTVYVTAVNSVGESKIVATEITTNVVLPAAVSNIETAIEGTTLTVEFEASANFGGDTSVSYDAILLDGSGKTVTTKKDVESGVSFEALERGKAYSVEIVTTNSAGSVSAKSNNVTVPAIAPTAPTNVVAAITGEDSAKVSWTVPESDGGAAISGYVVSYENSNGVVKTVTATGTSVVIEGLELGEEYTFSVVANNSAGSSAATVSSEAVATAPAELPLPATEAELETAIAEGLEELSLEQNGTILTVSVPGQADGAWFSGFAYSEPVSLGWAFVANEDLTFDISGAGLAVGDHRIALYDAAGELYGYADFTVAAAPVEPVPNEPTEPVAPVENGTPVDGKTAVKDSAKGLPRTGAEGVELLLLGSVLTLLLGAGLLLVARRRQSEV